MPRDITVTFDDGTTHQYKGAPDTVTPEQVQARAQREFGKTVSALDGGRPAESFASKAGGVARDVAAGAVRGAGSIGATLLYPIDKARDLYYGDREPTVKGLVTGQQPLSRNEERRRDMDNALADLVGADTDSLAYGVGKVGTEIAGTLGVGGTVANVAGRAVPALATRAPGLLQAIRTSGMTAGEGGNALTQLATRAAGGAVTGGASAGLVDPNEAGVGAALGGALPTATKVVGAAAHAAGRGVRAAIGQASPEVVALARRAKELGIDVPADRLLSSKPLDAAASALNYTPFSGRAATEARMVDQLSRATSRLMGQDTPNINQALRAASTDLGGKFDAVLRGHGVAFDQQLLQDVAAIHNTAERELGSDALKPIASQIDELVSKGADGAIDGQAAYNIKRTLDRIGRGNTPAAYHAIELKRALMDALNRSLGPEEAQAFAQTRRQYGNMLALEKLATNGVDGEISVSRLANLKNINNGELQEIADIAAQFVKPRETQHGAMQRAVVGLGAGLTGGLPGMAAVGAAGRAANTALNSNALRTIAGMPAGAAGQPNALQRLLASEDARLLAYRAAPTAGADR